MENKTSKITFFETPEGHLYSTKKLNEIDNNFVENFIANSCFVAKKFGEGYAQRVYTNNETLNAKTIVVNDVGASYIEFQITKFNKKNPNKTIMIKDSNRFNDDLSEFDLEACILATPENLHVVEIGPRGGLHYKGKLSKPDAKISSLLEDNTYDSPGIDSHIENHAKYITGK